MFITFFLVFGGPLQINLAPLGIYDEYGVTTIVKVDEGWILCSRAEDKLVWARSDGQIGKVYGKAGKGPGELNQPRIFQVTDSKVLVCNANGGIYEFDHQLSKAMPSKLPKYLLKVYHTPILGIESKSHFATFDLPVGFKNLVRSYKPQDGRWVKTAGFFTQKIPLLTKNDTAFEYSKVVFHGSTAFYMPKGYQEPYYEIFVHDFSNGRNDGPSAVLAREVDTKELNILGSHLFFDRAVVLKDGYLIELEMRKDGNKVKIHDYFSLEGRFLKRVQAGTRKLIPVQNSSEVFIFRDLDDPVLEIFNPEVFRKVN